jgi:predicted DNA-binding protein
LVDGKRGAPNKGEAAKRLQFTIPLTRALYAKLANFAAAIGESKAEAARRLIEQGVDELKRNRVET